MASAGASGLITVPVRLLFGLARTLPSITTAVPVPHDLSVSPEYRNDQEDDYPLHEASIPRFLRACTLMIKKNPWTNLSSKSTDVRIHEKNSMYQVPATNTSININNNKARTHASIPQQLALKANSAGNERVTHEIPFIWPERPEDTAAVLAKIEYVRSVCRRIQTDS